VNKKGFLGRRIQSLKRRWQALAGPDDEGEAGAFRPHLPPEDHPRLLDRMRESLDSHGGEIRARSRAASLGRIYLTLDAKGKETFFRLLAQEFDLDAEALGRALAILNGAGTPEELRQARKAVQAAAVAPRTRILTRFNALPQGVKFLVDLRADLLPLAKSDPTLASLDDDLKGLLTAWFDVDFLELSRISWHTASGALLEKFMEYEAVHPVENWDDLKNRLDHDRRYFAFFHPRMPDEPLIFLEVALVGGISGNVQELLDPSAPIGDPDQADTAIFYSISNAQMGLAGVSFGGFLIKRVVDELVQELPGLRTFATLSPLPGFRRWLDGVLEAEDPPSDSKADPGGEERRLVLPVDARRLRSWTDEREIREWLGGVVTENLWRDDPSLEEAVKPILLRLAARYLVEEKQEQGGARDPVANFHLSNGARVERLNWAGDLSEKGLAQSAGIMVNYLYDARRIENNHEAYKGTGAIAASPGVRGLLRK
jgi:malonyl-CoA decarboxylase